MTYPQWPQQSDLHRRLICNFRFKFCPVPPMEPLSTCTPEVTEARDVESHANRRSAVSRRPAFPARTHPGRTGRSGCVLNPAAGGRQRGMAQVAGASGDGSPHVQIADIEGEHGARKTTLARYLFSRSPLSTTGFQQRDAREWLVTDAGPATMAGLAYLDRFDLLAPPGQGLLMGALKALQDRPPGRAGAACSLGDSAAADGRPGPPDARSGLPVCGNPFRHFSICASAVRISARSPRLCSIASASGINNGMSRWTPRCLPAFCSTTGLAMCASCRACLKLHCWSRPTA